MASREPSGKLAVNRLDAKSDGGSGGASAFGELDRQLAPVVGVRSAVEVTTHHQRVDQLARRLLRHTEVLDEVAERRTIAGDAANHIGTIAR